MPRAGADGESLSLDGFDTPGQGLLNGRPRDRSPTMVPSDVFVASGHIQHLNN